MSAKSFAMAAVNAATTAGSNCPPAQRSSSSIASSDGATAPVGAVGDHRVVGVADGHDAGAERDLLAGEPIGIAAPVVALMARAHDRADAAELGRGADDPLADDRVLAHVFPLVGVERARGVQDGVGDRDLADVVQGGGAAGLEELSGRARGAPDRVDQVGDVVDVVGELAVVLGRDAQQHLVDGLVGRPAPGALVGVHALVGEPQGVHRVRVRAGQQRRSVRAVDRRSARRSR